MPYGCSRLIGALSDSGFRGIDHASGIASGIVIQTAATVRRLIRSSRIGDRIAMAAARVQIACLQRRRLAFFQGPLEVTAVPGQVVAGPGCSLWGTILMREAGWVPRPVSSPAPATRPGRCAAGGSGSRR